MMSLNNTRTRRQRGYSLAEMLVVVAIIGMISLVVVPNFISLYRSGRFKSAMRNFVTNVRNAQQRAISENRRTRISFATNGRTYQIAREMTHPTTGVRTWVTLSTQRLNPSGEGSAGTAFFLSTGFSDANSDGLQDVIFNPNGTVIDGVSEALPATPTVVIRTTDAIAKQTYTITFSLSGQVRAS